MTLPVSFPKPGRAVQLGIRAQTLEQQLESLLPPGMAYLVDDQGDYLVDSNGAFLYGPES